MIYNIRYYNLTITSTYVIRLVATNLYRHYSKNSINFKVRVNSRAADKPLLSLPTSFVLGVAWQRESAGLYDAG